jgi:hypothetical protein
MVIWYVTPCSLFIGTKFRTKLLPTFSVLAIPENEAAGSSEVLLKLLTQENAVIYTVWVESFNIRDDG